MADWKYVQKHGNPTTAGEYWVTLIYPEYDDAGNVIKRLACVDSRYFGEAKMNIGWIMSDQPDEDLVWTEDIGSAKDESVWAWMPMRIVPDIAEVPDDVEVEL